MNAHLFGIGGLLLGDVIQNNLVAMMSQCNLNHFILNEIS